jgi:hypothetical protein
MQMVAADKRAYEVRNFGLMRLPEKGRGRVFGR